MERCKRTGENEKSRRENETIAMDSAQDCHWTPFERKTAVDEEFGRSIGRRQYDSANEISGGEASF